MSKVVKFGGSSLASATQFAKVGKIITITVLIVAAVILSGVGCLNHVEIRLAKGKDYFIKDDDYEIISINGTISKDGSHIHIGLSDCKGNTIGGHLCYNCKVNTTCELVIQSIDSYRFTREYDDLTGYKEIVFEKEWTKWRIYT